MTIPVTSLKPKRIRISLRDRAEAAERQLSIVVAECDAARAEVERLTWGESILNERLTAARAEIGELKVQIRGLQIAARPMEPTESALMILLARQELLADTLQAERDEIVGLLDSYGWWMDNPDMMERLKFALATCQEKSDDLSTIRMTQRGASR